MTDALRNHSVFVTNPDIKKRTAFANIVRDHGGTLCYSLGAAVTHVAVADNATAAEIAAVRPALRDVVNDGRRDGRRRWWRWW